jgi:hypothetical protein
LISATGLTPPAVVPALTPEWLARGVQPFGSVDEIFLSPRPGAPLVVHIQDVHGLDEAQMNIARLIQNLSREGRVDMVGLEGGAGAFDLGPYRRYPYQEAKEKAARWAVKKDLIGGAEYAGIVNPDPLRLVGVEDVPLYLSHIRSVKDSLAGRAQAEEALIAYREALARINAVIATPDLRAYDANRSAYENHARPLGDYMRALAGFYEKGPAPLSLAQSFPHIHRFLDALKKEKELDFKSVERERVSLARTLSTRLDRPALDDLVRRSADYQTGRLSYGQYYDYLSTLCRRNAIARAAYPRLSAYIAYVGLCEKINRRELLAEIERFETVSQEGLTHTPAQREAASLGRDLALAVNLVHNQMTPEDWAAYSTRRESIIRFNQRLSDLVENVGSSFPPPLGGGGWPAGPGEGVDLSRLLPPFENFCRLTLDRNHALAQNLLTQMTDLKDGKRPATAILVAGGFHTPGLTRELRDCGVSYVVVTPRVTAVPEKSDYLDAFIRDPLPLEKMFQSEKISVITPRGTGAMPLPGDETETARIQDELNTSLLISTVGQRVREGCRLGLPQRGILWDLGKFVDRLVANVGESLRRLGPRVLGWRAERREVILSVAVSRFDVNIGDEKGAVSVSAENSRGRVKRFWLTLGLGLLINIGEVGLLIAKGQSIVSPVFSLSMSGLGVIFSMIGIVLMGGLIRWSLKAANQTDFVKRRNVALVLSGIVVGFGVIHLTLSSFWDIDVWGLFLRVQKQGGLPAVLTGGLIATVSATAARLIGMYLSDTAIRRSRLVVGGMFAFLTVWRSILGISMTIVFFGIEEYISPGVLRALVALGFGFMMAMAYDMMEPAVLSRIDAWKLGKEGRGKEAAQRRVSVKWREQWERVVKGVLGRITSSYFQHDLVQNVVVPELRILVLFMIGFLNNVFRATLAYHSKTRLSEIKVFLWGFFWSQMTGCLISPLSGQVAILLTVLSAFYFYRQNRKLDRADDARSNPELLKPPQSVLADLIPDVLSRLLTPVLGKKWGERAGKVLGSAVEGSWEELIFRGRLLDWVSYLGFVVSAVPAVGGDFSVDSGIYVPFGKMDPDLVWTAVHQFDSLGLLTVYAILTGLLHAFAIVHDAHQKGQPLTVTAFVKAILNHTLFAGLMMGLVYWDPLGLGILLPVALHTANNIAVRFGWKTFLGIPLRSQSIVPFRGPMLLKDLLARLKEAGSRTEANALLRVNSALLGKKGDRAVAWDVLRFTLYPDDAKGQYPRLEEMDTDPNLNQLVTVLWGGKAQSQEVGEKISGFKKMAGEHGFVSLAVTRNSHFSDFLSWIVTWQRDADASPVEGGVVVAIKNEIGSLAAQSFSIDEARFVRLANKAVARVNLEFAARDFITRELKNSNVVVLEVPLSVTEDRTSLAGAALVEMIAAFVASERKGKKLFLRPDGGATVAGVRKWTTDLFTSGLDDDTFRVLDKEGKDKKLFDVQDRLMVKHLLMKENRAKSLPVLVGEKFNLNDLDKSVVSIALFSLAKWMAEQKTWFQITNQSA